MDYAKIFGSPGATDLLHSMGSIRNTGMDLWNKMMQDAYNLYSGKESVTQLPYFGQMQSGFQDQIRKVMQQIMAQAQSRGVASPSIGNWQDILAKGGGDLIQQLFNTAEMGGQNAWSNWKGLRDAMANASLTSDQIEAQKQIAKMQQINQSAYGGISQAIKAIMGGISGGMGGGMMGG